MSDDELGTDCITVPGVTPGSTEAEGSWSRLRTLAGFWLRCVSGGCAGQIWDQGAYVVSCEEHSLLRFGYKTLTRGLLRRLIAPLVSWVPQVSPQEGLTVIIGCSRRLESLIFANLRLLSRQQSPSLREVILVLDGASTEMSAEFGRRLQEVSGSITVTCVYYDERQRRVTRRIDWGWVYAWLSWCLGIANCTTRYAMLHDFDALLLDPSIVEERYKLMRAGDAQYLGMGYYQGLGIDVGDRLVKTFELAFDAGFVRSTFRPIELFNTMARFHGKRVEFDTFLNAQSRAGRVDMVPIDELRMVHPSQMICQFSDLSSRPERLPMRHNLLLIPYYEFVGGDEARLRDMMARLTEARDGRVEAWGCKLDVRGIGQEHASWLRKQAYRVESAVHGMPRQLVVEYFDAIDRVVGSGGSTVERT